MSVLIKGIDMPRDCWNCMCVNKEYGTCQITDKTIYGDIPKWCPLVEIPTPHGRLIDADELKKDSVVKFFGTARIRDIDDAPTVIEKED